MLTRDTAQHFADDWISAWNSHDLARILAHYSDDFTMSSPRIADLTDEAGGVLHGKTAVADYWRVALAKAPELHFTLIDVFLGADSVAVHYHGIRGPVVEVFFFGADGLVQRAAAHYLP